MRQQPGREEQEEGHYRRPVGPVGGSKEREGRVSQEGGQILRKSQGTAIGENQTSSSDDPLVVPFHATHTSVGPSCHIS